MSTVHRVALLGLWAGLAAWGCASEDDDGLGDTQGSESSTTAPIDPTVVTSASAEGTSSGGAGEVGSDDDGSSGDPSGADSSSGGAGSTDEGEADSGSSETAGEIVFDEEFVWVADFLRANCTVCHATNANGNLLLTPADLSNDEVRLALEGVVATTGLMLVEPGDRQASQTYLQITNEFGAQFPVEDTDRFGAWIDAGAAYFAE